MKLDFSSGAIWFKWNYRGASIVILLSETLGFTSMIQALQNMDAMPILYGEA